MTTLLALALWAPLGDCGLWARAARPDSEWTGRCVAYLVALPAEDRQLRTLRSWSTVELQRAAAHVEAALAPPPPEGEASRCRADLPPLEGGDRARTLLLKAIQRRHSTFDPTRAEDFAPLLDAIARGARLKASDLEGGWSPSTLRVLRAAVFARHGAPLEAVDLESVFYAGVGGRPARARRASTRAPAALTEADKANLEALRRLIEARDRRAR